MAGNGTPLTKQDVYLGAQVCAAKKGEVFFASHFCLKIVQILGPTFWTEVGYGVGVAIEGIHDTYLSDV